MTLIELYEEPMQFKSATTLTNEELISISNQIEQQQENNPIFKTVIPEYLWKPAFGVPRNINAPFLRNASKNGYTGAVVKNIQDSATAVKWDIKPLEGVEMNEQDEKERQFIKNFFKNPNDDDESLAQIHKKIINDFSTLDSPCIVKVWNAFGELVQFRAIDGATITKNPDRHGRLGGRADFIMPTPDQLQMIQEGNSVNLMNSTTAIVTKDGKPVNGLNVTFENAIRSFNQAFGDTAAYYQYTVSGISTFPIPFGRKEIIYMMNNPAPDTVYSAGSPVELSIKQALNLIFGSDYSLDFFLNSNSPEGIINVAGASNEQTEALNNRLKEAIYTVDNTTGLRRRIGFKLPVTNAQAIDFKPLNFTSKDMEIIESQKWYSKLLWSNFGVNADELGFTEDSSKNVSKDQMKAAGRKGAKPFLDTIEWYYNNQMIKDLPGGEKFEFKFDYFDIEEEIKKRTLQKMELDMGIKTVEMIAEEEGIDITKLKEAQEEKMNMELRKIEMMNSQRNQNNQNEAQKEPTQNMKNKKTKTEVKSDKVEMKPFANYKDFDDCVRKNRNKKDPEAYCAVIMRKVEEKNIEEKARSVGGFESPEPGDIPEKAKQILASAYASCRKDGGSKEKCAKIAWGAVKNAGFKSEKKTEYKAATLEDLIDQIISEISRQAQDLIDETEQKKPSPSRENFFDLSFFKDDLFRTAVREFVRGSMKVANKANKDPPSVDNQDILLMTNNVGDFIKDVTDEMNKRIRVKVRDAILKGKTDSQLAEDLDEIFKGDNPTRFRYEDRLKMIARTETTQVLNAGAFKTAKELGAKTKWIDIVPGTPAHPNAQVSLEMDKKYGSPDKAIPIDEEFFVFVGGKEYRGLYPPFMPNDRDRVEYEFEDVENKFSNQGEEENNPTPEESTENENTDKTSLRLTPEDIEKINQDKDARAERVVTSNEKEDL